MRTQEAPYRILLQIFDWLERLVVDIAEQLDQLKGEGINKDGVERRGVPKDLSKSGSNPKVVPPILHGQPIYLEEFEEDKIDWGCMGFAYYDRHRPAKH